MMGRLPFLLALLVLAMLEQTWPAMAAEHPAECRVAENQIDRNFPLPQVARAIAAKQLTVLVLGAGSSLLPGSNGGKNAYPARLQHALAEKLPGVEVKVATDVKAKRTAAEMVKALPYRRWRRQSRRWWSGRPAPSTPSGQLIRINSARRSTRVLILPVPQALMSFSSIRNTVRVRNR